MKIETVLLACDDSPKFLSFLPSVAYHWRSMGYRVAFGLVTAAPLSSEREASLREHCDDLYVHVYSEPSRYSIIAMAKLFRFYLSKHYPTTTVCVQDIDYYVFDKHAHIEQLIQSPATEVLTHGYNAYYTTYLTESRSPPLVCYAVVPGLSSQTEMVYGLDGKLHLNGIGTGRLIRKKLYVPAVIRFPATPMVAHGRRLYAIFSTDESLSFDTFLDRLAVATRGFDPALNEGNNPYTLDSSAFSDESLIYQLNRTNKVVYRHTRRRDFVDTVAGARIDPRKSPDPESWYPLAKTHSVRDLLRAGYFVDIQPRRPLEDSPLMQEVFNALQIPQELLSACRVVCDSTVADE
jgi:hypothetical protein